MRPTFFQASLHQRVFRLSHITATCIACHLSNQRAIWVSIKQRASNATAQTRAGWKACREHETTIPVSSQTLSRTRRCALLWMDVRAQLPPSLPTASCPTEISRPLASLQKSNQQRKANQLTASHSIAALDNLIEAV